MTTYRPYCIASIAVVLLVPSFAFAQGAEPTPPPEPPAVAPPPPAAPAPPPPMGRSLDDEDERPAANSVFAEGLGAGVLYSINYERRVIDDLGVRIGFSYYSFGASAGTTSASVGFIAVPIGASYMGLRSGNHALEVGGGGTMIFATGESSSGGFASSGSAVSGLGNVLLGYRLHPVGKAGFQFRVGVMALIGPGLNLFDDDRMDAEKGEDKLDFGAVPWGYISFGAGF